MAKSLAVCEAILDYRAMHALARPRVTRLGRRVRVLPTGNVRVLPRTLSVAAMLTGFVFANLHLIKLLKIGEHQKSV